MVCPTPATSESERRLGRRGEPASRLGAGGTRGGTQSDWGRRHYGGGVARDSEARGPGCGSPRLGGGARRARIHDGGMFRDGAWHMDVHVPPYTINRGPLLVNERV
jgi:hypothetical protein